VVDFFFLFEQTETRQYCFSCPVMIYILIQVLGPSAISVLAQVRLCFDHDPPGTYEAAWSEWTQYHWKSSSMWTLVRALFLDLQRIAACAFPTSLGELDFWSIYKYLTLPLRCFCLYLLACMQTFCFIKFPKFA